MTKRAKTTLAIVIPISAIVSCALVVLIVIGLVNFLKPYSYGGEYKDLYSTAVWNIFGIRGFYSGGEFVRDPSIEIYEKDSKGRVLFAYYDGYYGVSDDNIGYFGGIVIMQYSDGNSIFCYDNCYLPVYQGTISGYKDVYSEDAINQFKIDNDWNLEINKDLCLEHPYVSRRPKGDLKIKEKEFESAIKTYVYNHGYKGDDTIYRYSYFSQKDKSGKELYYVKGCGTDVEGQGVSPNSVSKWYEFAIIFNEDRSCPESNIMEITDAKESANIIKELKISTDWNI